MSANPIPLSKRRAIWKWLIARQDSGVKAAESRRDAAMEFNVKVGDVVAVENEGIAREWKIPDLEHELCDDSLCEPCNKKRAAIITGEPETEPMGDGEA